MDGYPHRAQRAGGATCSHRLPGTGVRGRTKNGSPSEDRTEVAEVLRRAIREYTMPNDHTRDHSTVPYSGRRIDVEQRFPNVSVQVLGQRRRVSQWSYNNSINPSDRYPVDLMNIREYSQTNLFDWSV